MKRINKAQARKALQLGKTIKVIPHKMAIGTPWNIEATIDPSFLNRYNQEPFNFDKWLVSFTYYNCTNETGYYPAFYTEV